ncbi:hypothetical protein [Porphyromonas gulae]|uniref:hypothetical protein n=1 Tax=Porphyromonas gulae TaxID=111105 RepID=UPI003743A55C
MSLGSTGLSVNAQLWDSVKDNVSQSLSKSDDAQKDTSRKSGHLDMKIRSS